MCNNIYAQNNYGENPLKYYNLKDTINSFDMCTMEIPVFRIEDDELRDSLTQYIKELKEYNQNDEDGVFVMVYLGYTDDSINIHGIIFTCANFSMYSLLSDEHYDKANWYKPYAYKDYLVGCTLIDGYLVCIESKHYVPVQEIDRFFVRNDEHVTLRMFEADFYKTPIKYYKCQKNIIKPLVNRCNYVSPVIPR